MRRLNFPRCLFLASPLSGCTSGTQGRQRRSNFSPCFSFLESHSFFTESFSWVSEAKSTQRNTNGQKISSKISTPWSPPAGVKQSGRSVNLQTPCCHRKEWRPLARSNAISCYNSDLATKQQRRSASLYCGYVSRKRVGISSAVFTISVFILHYSLCNGNAGATYNFRNTKTKANKQTDNKRQSTRQGRIPQKKKKTEHYQRVFLCVCVFCFRKIDRKTGNDRGKMSFFVCVCVVYRKKRG